MFRTLAEATQSSSLLGDAVDETDAFNQHAELFTSVELAPALFALAVCRASPSILLSKRRTPFGWRANITKNLLPGEREVASYQYARFC